MRFKKERQEFFKEKVHKYKICRHSIKHLNQFDHSALSCEESFILIYDVLVYMRYIRKDKSFPTSWGKVRNYYKIFLILKEKYPSTYEIAMNTLLKYTDLEGWENGCDELLSIYEYYRDIIPEHSFPFTKERQQNS